MRKLLSKLPPTPLRSLRLRTPSLQSVVGDAPKNFPATQAQNAVMSVRVPGSIADAVTCASPGGGKKMRPRPLLTPVPVRRVTSDDAKETLVTPSSPTEPASAVAITGSDGVG